MIYLQSPEPFVSFSTIWNGFGYTKTSIGRRFSRYEITKPALEDSEILKAFFDAALQLDMRHYTNRYCAHKWVNFVNKKDFLNISICDVSDRQVLTFTDAKNPDHGFMVTVPAIFDDLMLYNIYYISVIDYSGIAKIPVIVGNIHYRVGDMINKKLLSTDVTLGGGYENRVLYSEPIRLSKKVKTHTHFCLECFPVDALLSVPLEVFPYRASVGFIKKCMEKNSTFISKGIVTDKTIHLI